MEFRPFKKIERIGKVFMRITQKIHGTNAQVAIIPNEQGILELHVGSRTKWITPENDNYGFAAFVYANKQEFIDKLGPGVHFGEWAGPGINSGEGLTQRTFVLFDYWRYPAGHPLPPQCTVVPVLYEGPIDAAMIDLNMTLLKANGSSLVPGFLRPEGVVVQIAGERYKKVFNAEETKWTKGDGNKERVRALSEVDYSHLLQPIRLEKLLSRDEAFVRDYPKSLGTIVNEYFIDLEAEGQITGDKDELKAIRKGASGLVFHFVKMQIEAMRITY